MIIPELPDNEQERLEALRSYRILDTLPEKDYDEITSLASLICGTPMSVITLVDEDRQFLKSEKGLGVNETSRKYGFCSHSILNPDEITVVPDSRKDPRFSENPYVTGEPHLVFYAGVPLKTSDGYALGTLCVLDSKPHEISAEQLQALKALTNQVINLLELRRKNLLLEKAQKKLELYAGQMENFASLASHDLKEPLRMINNFLYLFHQKYGQTLDEKGKNYIQFARDGAQRMTTLINNLLNYARIAGDDKETEDVYLEDVIKEVISIYSASIEEAGASLEYGKLPVIRSQATPLLLLFQNLIGNSLKYRNPEVKPVIRIGAETTENYWKFFVSDNGIGIPEKHHKEIFKAFSRVHTAEVYPGTGMGLATCKKFVEQQGGEIWVASEENNGSTFYFTLPK